MIAEALQHGRGMNGLLRGAAGPMRGFGLPKSAYHLLTEGRIEKDRLYVPG